MKKALAIIVFLLAIHYSYAQPEAVDLGLSVKWASCNVGAEKPSDYGDYFAWGETKPKTKYSESNYRWRGRKERHVFNKGKWNEEEEYLYTGEDFFRRLPLDEDAARVNWGAPWRMPTWNEWEELKENCKWEWVWDVVYGYRVTGPNGNSIFLPAAGWMIDDDEIQGKGRFGRYWSSSKFGNMEPGGVFARDFSSDAIEHAKYAYRWFGIPVRPVF